MRTPDTTAAGPGTRWRWRWRRPLPGRRQSTGGAVVLSAVITTWWLVRLLRYPGHRAHSACHLLMAAGMALMLALM